MASTFRLHKPYVLAALPRPLDRSSAVYRVGDVFGESGSKKRKRPELVVGVDGEAASLYDVSCFLTNVYREETSNRRRFRLVGC